MNNEALLATPPSLFDRASLYRLTARYAALLCISLLAGCEPVDPEREALAQPTVNARIVVINSGIMPQRYATVDLSIVPYQVLEHDVPEATNLIEIECIDGVMIALARHAGSPGCEFHVFDAGTGLGESIWRAEEGAVGYFESLAVLDHRCFWIMNDEIWSLNTRSRTGTNTRLQARQTNGIATNGKQLVFMNEQNELCTWDGDAAAPPAVIKSFGEREVFIQGCIPGAVLCSVEFRDTVVDLSGGYRMRQISFVALLSFFEQVPKMCFASLAKTGSPLLPKCPGEARCGRNSSGSAMARDR